MTTEAKPDPRPDPRPAPDESAFNARVSEVARQRRDAIAEDIRDTISLNPGVPQIEVTMAVLLRRLAIAEAILQVLPTAMVESVKLGRGDK